MKLNKPVLLLLSFILVLPFLMTGQARAAAKPITIELNGTELSSDVPPYLTRSNVTMVPLRVISQGLGAGVSWNQGSRTVTITGEDAVLKLTSGQRKALVNGASVSLDSSVELRSGRVMVPIRFVSEQLGLQVIWNGAAQHITLMSKAKVPQASEPAGPAIPAVPSVPVPSVPSLPSLPGGKSGKAMKGAWISSVFNLDWPSASSAGKPDRQKAEYDSMLDKLKAAGFNAVFVQVRPSGDSLYPSALVPWSKVLTGTQGKDPGYDPMDYIVKSAHERGMEFHAWFNPFRATNDTAAGTLAGLSAAHVSKAHPEWIVTAGGKQYINPGIPAARQHIIDTVMEVVQRYGIDGVHLDDYFYPSGVSFADDAAFLAYNPEGISNKSDWRRSNINAFIRQLGESIHAVKPAVSYGVSPFGVWRNLKNDSTGSDTAAGVTAYDSMYADVRTWIRAGWIDYVAPQVYWSLSFSAARYDKVVDWWVNEVKGTGVKLYIGHAAYKVGAADQKAEWQSGEQIINQLKYNEKYAEIQGSILFRANDIVGRNPFGLSGLLALYFNS